MTIQKKNGTIEKSVINRNRETLFYVEKELVDGEEVFSLYRVNTYGKIVKTYYSYDNFILTFGCDPRMTILKALRLMESDLYNYYNEKEVQAMINCIDYLKASSKLKTKNGIYINPIINQSNKQSLIRLIDGYNKFYEQSAGYEIEKASTDKVLAMAQDEFAYLRSIGNTNNYDRNVVIPLMEDENLNMSRIESELYLDDKVRVRKDEAI